MQTKTRMLVLVGIAFFCLGIMSAGLLEKSENQFDNAEHLFTYNLEVPAVYEAAIATSNEVQRTGARSAIVAHHLLVADKIAQTLATLGTGEEETVVVLSPNHFDLGRGEMQVTDGVWKTYLGEMEVDTDALERLMDEVPGLRDESDTFTQEHGVSAIVPFVQSAFSDAKIVPIIIHESATQEDVHQLAEGIAEVLPDAIVVASIDMSHNLPEYVRVPHDELTLAAIESGSCNGACRLEVDANTVLETIFEVNRLRGEQDWNQVHHGSSLAMGATSDWEENTSHILGYFTEGEADGESVVSMKFVGDIMLDRWVRTLMELNGDAYPWEKVERFLMGVDVTVGNLEGTVSEAESEATEDPPFRFTFSPESVETMSSYVDVVSLANNHSRDRGIEGEMETQVWMDILDIDWFAGYAYADPVYQEGDVSLVGVHAFATDLEQVRSVIEEEQEADQFVVVFAHWGEEYINEPRPEQRTQAEQLVEAGADLIIGAHPHVIQGIEMIDGVPVVYSLGNFIFDSELPGTEQGLSVLVQLSEEGGMVYLLPLRVEAGQPTPVSDEEAQTLFSTIASVSSDELASHILTGVVPFSYD